MGSERNNNYEIIPFPKLRRSALDAGYLGKKRHTIHGLVEFDVSKARHLIRDEEARSGVKLSFSAFVINCLGKAVTSNRHVHAYRNWRNQLIIFDDVNVNIMIEVTIDDQRVPMPYIIKAVNKRTLRQIHDEIRGAQKDPKRTMESKYLTKFLLLPTFARRLVYRFITRFPQLLRDYASSVLVTAVGMFGEGSGWGIPLANFSLLITLGGIAEKPCVRNGQIEICEILNATLSFDHDIIDGAPAARFTQDFKELVEDAYGLPQPQ
jgi:pyruvate/2-oxoglutarate dehydrogenase complex dihydrolipoamide acyltransferase (E2) component